MEEMEATSSISKGVFVFKNGFKLPKRTKKSSKETVKNPNIQTDQLWYQSYKDFWNVIDKKIKKLNNRIFSNTLESFLDCIKKCYVDEVYQIPTLALLTGINTPDSAEQFAALSEEIKDSLSPHCITLYAEDCSTTKSLIENVVSQFVNSDSDDEFDEEDEVIAKKKIKKSSCTLFYLHQWYTREYSNLPDKRQKKKKKLLVIIFPEFESFQEKVLQDFILMCSEYINTLPIVLVFGVATSVSALHKAFTYKISSKLFIYAFNSHTASEYLNNILENVILSENVPFHLGGKLFQLLVDIFLFYDFSVKGFVQSFKFSVLQHFSFKNSMALCTSPDRTEYVLQKFGHEEFEGIRRLMSFRKYVEAQDFKTRIELLEQDEYLKKVLKDEVDDFHNYLFCFHVMLNCVHILVGDLPRAPLGKQVRELYAKATSEKITETTEYKESLQLLNFLSKDELLSKICQICDILKKICKNNEAPQLETFLKTLSVYLVEIKEADFTFEEEDKTSNQLDEKLNRAALKQKLLDMAKHSKKQNKYEKVRERFFKDFTTFVDKHLEVPSSKPFHEIFFCDNVTAVRDHIMGQHRAALHTALNNPQYYLQCDCCHLPNDSAIVSTMPDICIVYKLHLECGKFINMYDWLQAFVAVVNPQEDEDTDETDVDPKLQARFTRAVAELEFLGFIKTSKRKTDHVMRLTWGG